jgi:hypothetical protein
MAAARKFAKTSSQTLVTKELPVASRQHISRFLFHQGIFYQNNISPTHHTFLLPQLKIKLKGCYFDITEVIEAESQVVLNTLTEQNFQDAFKKRAESLGMVRMHGRGLL